MRNVIVVGIVLALTAPAGGAEADDAQVLYALGTAMSANIVPFELSEKEIGMVTDGMRDGLLGKKEAQTQLEKYGPQIQALATRRTQAASAREKEAGKSFLENAGKEKGAITTESGLIYQEIKPGKGASPNGTSQVKVHYHGVLRDGTVFDSSVERDEPATFTLDKVVGCWTEGLQKMKVGGKSKLTCPSQITYGDRGAPPLVKPGATLQFEVELLEIVKQ
jgi:FKBP-type peptidyl-prolyl cis-trans isomerase FkpA/FKBP-type peptidyl-prolyl cis-trans isomerase FklB